MKLIIKNEWGITNDIIDDLTDVKFDEVCHFELQLQRKMYKWWMMFLMMLLLLQCVIDFMVFTPLYMTINVYGRIWNENSRKNI